jgi:hypothetical protein
VTTIEELIEVLLPLLPDAEVTTDETGRWSSARAQGNVRLGEPPRLFADLLLPLRY